MAGFATLNPAADKADVVATMAAEFAKLRDTRVSVAELSEAKNELLASALRRRETASGRAFELGEALVSTGDPDGADIRLKRFTAVTAAEVQRVARTYLAPESVVNWRYETGPDNPQAYANPVPMPTYASVPPATGKPALLKPEGERTAPPAPSAAPQVARADFVESRLTNGVPLVVAQTGQVPIATMTVVLPGGSATGSWQSARAAGVRGPARKGTDYYPLVLANAVLGAGSRWRLRIWMADPTSARLPTA